MLMGAWKLWGGPSKNERAFLYQPSYCDKNLLSCCANVRKLIAIFLMDFTELLSIYPGWCQIQLGGEPLENVPYQLSYWLLMCIWSIHLITVKRCNVFTLKNVYDNGARSEKYVRVVPIHLSDIRLLFSHQPRYKYSQTKRFSRSIVESEGEISSGLIPAHLAVESLQKHCLPVCTQRRDLKMQIFSF